MKDTNKGPRKPREPDDIEMLKAWCHWARVRNDLDTDELDLVKSVENLISQVGTWKAKYERVQKTRDATETDARELMRTVGELQKECAELRAELDTHSLSKPDVLNSDS